MKRFYQVFAFFLLLHLWTPCVKGQPVAPNGAVQVLDVHSAPVDGGKKLRLSVTITNYGQLTELAIVQDGLAPEEAGPYGGVSNFTPYYYLGDLFLVYRDKKLPFTGNQVELEIDLVAATKSPSTSLTLVALDRNGLRSAPFIHAYK
ncbi:MAG TPA: hypothetical protein VF646_08860 [Cytophagales bacterium]